MPRRVSALLSRLGKSWPSIVSGLLMLAAFPPFDLGLLVFVALVPWLANLKNLTGKEAWRSGYGLGFVFGLGQLFWLAQLTSKWTGSLLLGVVPWLIACALYAIYFGWTGVLVQRCLQRGWLWAVPLAWAGVEVVRSYLPIVAFPWGLLAMPLWPIPPLIQTASYGTIYFVSAWVVLVNMVVYTLFFGEGVMRARSLMTASFLVVAFSILLYDRVPSGQEKRIVVGQPGVDMAFSDPDAVIVNLGKNISAIVETAKGADLLVLPEGVAEAPSMPPRPVFRLDPEIPTLFGGRRGSGPAYQTAFGFDGKWTYADKTRLVIFGEFVPGRDLFPFLAESFRLPAGDLAAGKDGVRAIKVGGIQTGPVLCFEALFPDIAYRQSQNDAQILAVMSIDDWFMDGVAPEQLKAASVWRAVETRLPVVRSATTGYTMAIDRRGNVLAQSPLGKTDALSVKLPLPEKPPTWPWLPAFPMLAGVFALGLSLARTNVVSP